MATNNTGNSNFNSITSNLDDTWVGSQTVSIPATSSLAYIGDPACSFNVTQLGQTPSTVYYRMPADITVEDIEAEIYKYLDEKLIQKMLDNVIENAPSDKSKEIIRVAVRARHYSEKFLLKYANYVTNSDIMKNHEENIVSKEYPTIALLIKTREE